VAAVQRHDMLTWTTWTWYQSCLSSLLQCDFMWLQVVSYWMSFTVLMFTMVMDLKEQQVSSEWPIFISETIIGDETWIYGHDLKTKQNSSWWKSSSSQHPKKAKQVHFNVKSILIIFLYCLCHLTWVCPTESNCQPALLQRCPTVPAGAVRLKHPGKWHAFWWWLLHHANGPAHTSLSVQYLAKNNMAMIPPPYSPDLAPSDSFLIPRLKFKLKGRKFNDSLEIQQK